jgi:hypothetical protein
MEQVAVILQWSLRNENASGLQNPTRISQLLIEIGQVLNHVPHVEHVGRARKFRGIGGENSDTCLLFGYPGYVRTKLDAYRYPSHFSRS